MTVLDGPAWRPLPRPEELAATVAVRRIDDPAPRLLTRPERLRAASGGPELVDGDRRAARVRFWHRATQARAVALSASGWWRPDDPRACDLEHLGDGCWSATFEVPADWQVGYRFLEHAGADEPPWLAHGLRCAGVRAVPDTADVERREWRGALGSVLRLPEAVRPWTTGSATDEPEPFAQAAAHRVRLWRPRGTPRGPLPLLVVTDGEDHLERSRTPRLLQRAVELGVLVPLAVAFVDAGPRRPEDLGVPGGQAAWIAERLVPQLRDHGFAVHDARRTVVAGASFGGLSALFAAVRAPATVGAAIALSPSLWRYPEHAIADAVAAADARSPLRVRIRSGIYEGTMLPMSRALAERLEAAGVDTRCLPASGGHDWTWWVPAIVEEAGELLGPGHR